MPTPLRGMEGMPLDRIRTCLAEAFSRDFDGALWWLGGSAINDAMSRGSYGLDAWLPSKWRASGNFPPTLLDPRPLEPLPRRVGLLRLARLSARLSRTHACPVDLVSLAVDESDFPERLKDHLKLRLIDHPGELPKVLLKFAARPDVPAHLKTVLRRLAV